MFELAFVLFSGGDDDGIADVGFVFVVGAVAGLFGFLRAFVVVGCGAAQFRFQGGSSGRVLRPRVEHVEDRQGRAAVRGRIADGDLFLHREQLDHPQQRPVQFAQRVVRSSDPQFAATERLLERAELQFDAPAQLIELARCVAGQCFWIEDVGDQIDRHATELQRDQAQHQRRLFFASRFVRQEVDDLVRLAFNAPLSSRTMIAIDSILRVGRRYLLLVRGDRL